MITVIFEVEPAADQRARYFDIPATLRPQLSEIDGFISIERFQSLSDKRRILSLSFWPDEAAVTPWRNLEPHRAPQAAGKLVFFAITACALPKSPATTA